MLALTEVNWNSTEFAQRDPIMLRAADQVSDILRYISEDESIDRRTRAYVGLLIWLPESSFHERT